MNEKSLQTTTKNLGYFDAGQLEQALRIAEKFHKAGCFGSDVKNPEQAFVKIQAGAEMGMAPMEAMSSLYIVNGKVTIFGVALSKRLREFGWKIEYLESTETIAKVKISKDNESYEYTATPSELKNSQAMKFAPKDKLKWHALSRLVRFNVPEVLGPVRYTREEMEDVIDAEVIQVIPSGLTLEDMKAKIENIKTDDEYKKIMNELSAIKNGLTDEERKALIAVAKNKLGELQAKVFTDQEPRKEPEADKETGEVVDSRQTQII